MQIWLSSVSLQRSMIFERNDFSDASKIFFSTLAIHFSRAIHNGISAINADIYTEYYRAIGSREKGLDMRIDAQSRAKGEGKRKREREREMNVTKVAISFVNTIPSVGQRRVTIIERIMRLISITDTKDRGNRFVKCLRDHPRDQHNVFTLVNLEKNSDVFSSESCEVISRLFSLLCLIINRLIRD